MRARALTRRAHAARSPGARTRRAVARAARDLQAGARSFRHRAGGHEARAQCRRAQPLQADTIRPHGEDRGRR